MACQHSAQSLLLLGFLNLALHHATLSRAAFCEQDESPGQIEVWQVLLDASKDGKIQLLQTSVHVPPKLQSMGSRAQRELRKHPLELLEAKVRSQRADSGFLAYAIYLLIEAAIYLGGAALAKVLLGICAVALLIFLHYWLLLPPHQRTPPAEPREEDDSAEAYKETERKCHICMDAAIKTVVLPCRHSTMCRECVEKVLGGTRQCPVCRAYISYTLFGNFEDDFVDFAVRAVNSAGAQIVQARSHMLREMYDRIRGLVTLGILAALASVACFIWSPQHWPGIILAIYAVCVGYLPWFAVTADAYDREDPSLPRPSLCTEEDCARPYRLFMKALLMTVVVPLATVLFFLPYAVLAFILRPVAKHLLPAMIYGILWIFLAIACYGWLYIVHPLLSAIDTVLLAAVRIIMAVCTAFYDWILCPIYNSVLVPLWCGLTVLLRLPRWIVLVFYEYLLAPLGQILLRAAHACGQLLIRAADTTWAGICWAAAGLWAGLSWPANGLYTYVLSPIMLATSSAASALYAYVLLPMGTSIAGAATALYNHMLLPICSFIQSYVFAPIASSIWLIGSAAYSYILQPGAQYLGLAISTAAAAVSSVVSATEAAFRSMFR